MVVVNLPDGPTAKFKLSSVVLSKNIPNHGKSTSHLPEIIINNFNTRLGHSIGRLFASMFPINPQFRGRRVVTFHNQRDFIFFRHHRYIFEKQDSNSVSKSSDKKPEPVKVRLQELGPRFCIKLKSLQNGTFDPNSGQFEWVHKVCFLFLFLNFFSLKWIQAGEDFSCKRNKYLQEDVFSFSLEMSYFYHTCCVTLRWEQFSVSEFAFRVS